MEEAPYSSILTQVASALCNSTEFISPAGNTKTPIFFDITSFSGKIILFFLFLLQYIPSLQVSIFGL